VNIKTRSILQRQVASGNKSVYIKDLNTHVTQSKQVLLQTIS